MGSWLCAVAVMNRVVVGNVVRNSIVVSSDDVAALVILCLVVAVADIATTSGIIAIALAVLLTLS